MNLLSLFFYSKELTYVRRTRLLGITVETNRVFGYVTLIRFWNKILVDLLLARRDG